MFIGSFMVFFSFSSTAEYFYFSHFDTKASAVMFAPLMKSHKCRLCFYTEIVYTEFLIAEK